MKTKTLFVTVLHDDTAENPRTMYDGHLGLFAGWHRNYKIGDVQPKQDRAEWLKENAPPGSVVLNVWMMDHSGVRYSTSDAGFRAADPQRWDWGWVGFIVATPERIRELYGVKRITKALRERVKEVLKAEIKTYDAWASGDTWGVRWGTADNEDNADSCWGFIGDDLDGMKGCVPAEYHPALEAAWKARFGEGGRGTVEVPDPEGAAAEKRAAEYRGAARGTLELHGISEGDAPISEDADVDEVEHGAWVTVRLWVSKLAAEPTEG